jgi:cytochrome P450
MNEMDKNRQHPPVSILDTFLLHALHFLPLFARGLFLPKRWVYRLLAHSAWPRLARTLICGLRAKYGSDHLWVSLLRIKKPFRLALGRTLLVYDAESIRTILHTPAACQGRPERFAADPPVKRERVGLFAPGALVMSGGEQACPKRELNHRVLESERPIHHHGAAFLGLIRVETARILAQDARELKWDQFAELSLRVTLQVVLGEGRVDRGLFEHLERMIASASCVALPLRSRRFDAFYAALEQHLQRNPGPALIEGWAELFGSDSPPSWSAYQVTHWLFAMKDSLETHTARTLALLAAHPQTESEVHRELHQALGETSSQVGVLDAGAIASLRLLEGCVNEAIRLWTPIPLLVRRVVAPVELGGAMVPKDCDVVIDAGYNHRDPRRYGIAADRFSPKLWVNGGPMPPMDHFSNGERQCAGMRLGLFLIKAIVAELLLADRFALDKPHLDASEPLPLALDHYAIRFRRGAA